MSVVFWIAVAAAILGGCSGRKKKLARKKQAARQNCTVRFSVRVMDDGCSDR